MFIYPCLLCAGSWVVVDGSFKSPSSHSSFLQASIEVNRWKLWLHHPASLCTPRPYSLPPSFFQTPHFSLSSAPSGIVYRLPILYPSLIDLAVFRLRTSSPLPLHLWLSVAFQFYNGSCGLQLRNDSFAMELRRCVPVQFLSTVARFSCQLYTELVLLWSPAAADKVY